MLYREVLDVGRSLGELGPEPEVGESDGEPALVVGEEPRDTAHCDMYLIETPSPSASMPLLSVPLPNPDHLWSDLVRDALYALNSQTSER